MVLGDKQNLKSTDINTSQTSGGWFDTSWLWSWKPTSMCLLQKSENQLFSYVKCTLEKKFVELKNGTKIWTIMSQGGNQAKRKTPLVLVHGFGGGVGLWVLNYAALAQHRQLFAFDVLGFGQSSRPQFPSKPEEAEETFVESIENWRNKLEIDEMILLGHSFGGYLSTCYALKYPDRVKSLILADPWGFPERNPNQPSRAPLWIRVLVNLMSPFNPLALVRVAGPLGPGLVKKLRSDFRDKFQTLDENNETAILDYIYHCNAANPSGESGFKSISGPLGYAHRPILNRIGNLDPNIQVTFIYGARSWMDQNSGRIAQTLLPRNRVDVFSIKGAGHHVYADRPELFHEIIQTICDDVTSEPSTTSPTPSDTPVTSSPIPHITEDMNQDDVVFD